MEDDNTDNYNQDVNNGARHAKNGAEDSGHHVARATGKGLNHAKNTPKGARQAAGLGTQGAGKGMEATGAGMQGAGKATNGVGKGVQAAGNATKAIPYAGPAIGGTLDVAGKGISGLGKGTDKAGQHLRHQGQKVDKAGKRIRNGGTSAKGAGKVTSFFARLAAHGGLLFLSAFVIFVIILMLIFGIVLGGDNAPQCGGGSNTEESNDMSGVNGDWTKKGTKSYNAAKSMFIDAKHDGCDDKHAAAVVGNGIHESAYFGTHIGLSWTIWPHQGGGGPGVGIYQFSDDGSGCPPPSNHSIAAQTKQILTKGGNDSEFKHASGTPYELGMKFDILVERGDRTPDRCSLSQKAYELFNGTGGGSSDDASDTADSGSSCGGDESDSPDGTGSISEKNPSDINNWKWSQLPSDIKKYAHNPADAGMSYGSSKGWSDTTFPDQCVPFACSYFHAIWGLPKGTVGGDGSNMADSWHAALPGSTESKTPHAGAIAGSTYGPVGGNHTWIVLHVLSNGDTIVAEQNMVSREGHGGSGSHIGKPYTWDIGLRNKNTPDTEYTMPPKKYHLHWSK